MSSTAEETDINDDHGVVILKEKDSLTSLNNIPSYVMPASEGNYLLEI